MYKFTVIEVVRDVRFKLFIGILIFVVLALSYYTRPTANTDSYSERFTTYVEMYSKDRETMVKENKQDDPFFKELEALLSNARKKESYINNGNWKKAFAMEIKDIEKTKNDLFHSDAELSEGLDKSRMLLELDIDSALFSYFIKNDVFPKSQEANAEGFVNTFRYLSIIMPIIYIFLLAMLVSHQYSLDYKNNFNFKLLEPITVRRIKCIKLFVLIGVSFISLFVSTGLIFGISGCLNGIGSPKFPIVIQKIDGFTLVPIQQILLETILLSILVGLFMITLLYLMYSLIKKESIVLIAFLFAGVGSQMIPSGMKKIDSIIHFNVFSYLNPVAITTNAQAVKYHNPHFNVGNAFIFLSVSFLTLLIVNLVRKN